MSLLSKILPDVLPSDGIPYTKYLYDSLPATYRRTSEYKPHVPRTHSHLAFRVLVICAFLEVVLMNWGLQLQNLMHGARWGVGLGASFVVVQLGVGVLFVSCFQTVSKLNSHNF